MRLPLTPLLLRCARGYPPKEAGSQAQVRGSRLPTCPWRKPRPRPRAPPRSSSSPLAAPLSSPRPTPPRPRPAHPPSPALLLIKREWPLSRPVFQTAGPAAAPGRLPKVLGGSQTPLLKFWLPSGTSQGRGWGGGFPASSRNLGSLGPGLDLEGVLLVSVSFRVYSP